MEKSFHPSTLHLVSDLIEIGSHDDSHRRNLASLETISLIAFALRIRTWETLLLLLLLLVFVHTPRHIIGGPNLHFPPFPLSILFNRLRNSNVARLEFRLWCTAPPQLLSTAISPLARAVDANPLLPRRVLVRRRSTPVSSLPFGIRTFEGCASVCSSRARESLPSYSWINEWEAGRGNRAEEIRRDCLRLEIAIRGSCGFFEYLDFFETIHFNIREEKLEEII